MAPRVPLERLQRWMQAVVVHPGEAEEALASPAAEAEVPARQVDEVVLPSAHLRGRERVAIYHGMYLLRMEEALQTDYPALQHFLGEEGFRGLVRDYVQAHPSRSFTLNHLGAHLPEFVRTARVPRPAFCHELARLERAVSEVFDAPETRPLAAEEVAAVPEDAWETSRLEPIAALRLLAFGYPVSAYASSVREEDHRHPPFRRERTWVVVHRREYQVLRRDLSRAQADLLGDLVAGRPLGLAVAAAARRPGRARADEHQLFRWFREWVAAGLFARVVTARQPTGT